MAENTFKTLIVRWFWRLLPHWCLADVQWWVPWYLDRFIGFPRPVRHPVAPNDTPKMLVRIALTFRVFQDNPARFYGFRVHHRPRPESWRAHHPTTIMSMVAIARPAPFTQPTFPSALYGQTGFPASNFQWIFLRNVAEFCQIFVTGIMRCRQLTFESTAGILLSDVFSGRLISNIDASRPKVSVVAGG